MTLVDTKYSTDMGTAISQKGAVTRELSSRWPMIGVLLYVGTAVLIFAGYAVLEFFGPRLASEVVPAIRGAIVLVVATLVHFWKPRIGAGVALFGAVLIWPVCWLFGWIIRASMFNYYAAWWGLAMFLPFVVITLLVATVSTYALILVSGVGRYLDLPIWLVPDKPMAIKVSAAIVSRPPSVKTALVLLYAWWAILALQILTRLQWIFHGGGAINPGYAAWGFDAIVGVGALWIVMEIGNGKSWARLGLLLIFLMRVWSLVVLIRTSPERGFNFFISLSAFLLQAAGLYLVYNKTSAAYFHEN